MEFTLEQDVLSGEILEKLKSYFSRIDTSECALAYSGGLDSTLVFAVGGYKAKPYTLGVSGSRDFANASLASNLLSFKTTFIDVSKFEISRYISIMKEIDPEINNSDLGFELVLAVLLDKVPEDRIITGQGADELFYGYHRFLDNPELTNSGHLDKLYKATLPRERKLAAYFGKQLITPYLDAGLEEMLETAGREIHFSGETNKVLLRLAGKKIGLPDEIISVRKKAAQYGSGIAKLLKNPSAEASPR